MRRVVLTVSAALVAAAAVAAPVFASQCPKLIQAVNNEANRRFDNAAYTARQKAAEAQKLHSEGKHAESEKAAQEAMTLLGIKM
jgi:hypothetical protein